MIKPTFWVSKTLTRVSRDARLMFIGLWNFSDDYGVLDNSNRRIMGNVFPYDMAVTEKDIQAWKDELVSVGLLVKIEWSNQSYLYIHSWTEHQKVDHKGKETVPQEVILQTLATPSRETSEPLDRKIKIKSKIKIKDTNVSASQDEPEDSEEKKTKTYGDKSVNGMLEALKVKIGISAFVDSAIERNMATHCVNLMNKIGTDVFVRRLEVLLSDEFHRKNCNKIKYVYNNIKGFIDQPKKSRVAKINY